MDPGTPRAELWISFDGIYQRALSIPVNTCQRFSIHPLTWLRYLAYIIYGNEGHISTTPGGPEVEYYQPNILPGAYYYVSQEPFLLLDPDAMDNRTTDVSSSSTGRDDFRHKVAARDGSFCVMTGPAFAKACHIIPHAKGHQYMINLMEYRNVPFNGPPLEDINDPRNGILLATQLHHWFGTSDVAFLKTPNFAMTVNDVDLVMQPNANNLGFTTPPSLANYRLTFQNFNTNDPIVMLVAPHNSDARPSVGDEWPPDLIFDFAYGCAALKAWGMGDFIQFVRERTNNIYYNFDDGGGGGELPSLRRSERIRDQVRNNHKAAGQKKAQRLARNTEDGQGIDFADIMLALWTRNAKKCQHQAHAKKVDNSREKVQKWLESTGSSMDS